MSKMAKTDPKVANCWRIPGDPGSTFWEQLLMKQVRNWPERGAVFSFLHSTSRVLWVAFSVLITSEISPMPGIGGSVSHTAKVQ